MPVKNGLSNDSNKVAARQELFQTNCINRFAYCFKTGKNFSRNAGLSATKPAFKKNGILAAIRYDYQAIRMTGTLANNQALCPGKQ